jgi:hypothetical protein
VPSQLEFLLIKANSMSLNQRVSGSSPGAPTTHSLGLCCLQGTRDTVAISKTCAPSSLTCAVSAHEPAAHKPIFAPCLRVENSRSRLRFRDEFDDCVVGSQFDIYCLHHPVSRNPQPTARQHKGRFCGHSRVWWSPISGLCAETSSSGPFWRASLWRQKSRSKLE